MTENTDRRYPGNSHQKIIRVEETPPKMVKVIKGEAVLKTPVGRRILNSFRGDDGRTVGEHVLFEIIIPSIKDIIVDAGKDALERAFFGSSVGHRSSPRSRGTSFSYGNNKTQYAKRYQSFENTDDRRGSNREERRQPNRSRVRGSFDEVLLETRGDAEEALDALRSAIDQFGQVSVADLYDLVDISTDYMDRAWGWKDLDDAAVKRMRSDLYILDLPQTVQLD